MQLINAGALAQNVTATFTLPVGGRFTSATVQENAGTCEVSADRVVCNVPRVEYFKRIIFDLSYVAAERLDGADMVLRASTGEDNTADFSFWLTAHFPVMTTADEGPDSLRQALLEAREHCADRPCAIDFLVSGTIAPVSPLPEVWGRVKIDGGGEIEIDGSALPEGSDGLVLRTGCDNSVSNLTIKNVPRHAIEVHATEPATPCLLGFYYPIIAGNRLTGNERGVVQSAGSWIQIRDNVIRGNRRAGIFLGTGFYASITHNTIVENGASGIFLNLGDSSRSTVAGADVEGNVIANNGEWGLCRTPNGEVSLTDNSIYGNVSAGIDIGLDNETPNRENDGNGTPNKPELFSATYDAAAGTTTIRGHIQSRPIVGGGLRIDVYASSSLSLWGYAQGEEKVGVKFLLPGSADFEVIVPRDLRGKFITATNTRSHNVGWAQPPQEQSHTNSAPGDTSEFSNAIQVQ